MPAEESCIATVKEDTGDSRQESDGSSLDTRTGIYSSLFQFGEYHRTPSSPNLHTASFVLSQFPHPYHADSRVAFIDAVSNRQLTYGQLRRSIRALASGLHHVGINKGDVFFVLSPKSLSYPVICLVIFLIGAVLSPANPINTASEIAKQVGDSGAKLAISAPEELHKLVQTGVSTIITSHGHGGYTVLLRHLRNKQGCSINACKFHSHNQTPEMRFDMEAMIDAIQAHKVNNIPAVPPVILGLVKQGRLGSRLASLRRVGSGAAPLSKEVTSAFRERFPWVQLRQGSGLTETSGEATFFVSDEQAKARPEATATILDKDGWLRTGDLGYFDENEFHYIVDRIKELIKHNGCQVAPAELEAVLLSHSQFWMLQFYRELQPQKCLLSLFLLL
ncbi:hypothetical protein SLEP1_g42613 [Rubroshorea leprosula]|uniref:AMP-dependent synthetase/ligase domain-containing protein n=1 Tax=Rubroshorea leprosula TaxID=152421 RepID=A0AAV5LAE7_9ROSI|nr:hypothetical protein SLEP1_g42613 [Rubroshorea leprosula]